MTATIIHRKKAYTIHPGTTIRSAMEKLNIQPESVIPTIKGELVSEDQIIKDGDVVRLVAVISGG